MISGEKTVIGFTIAGTLLVGGYATTSLAADQNSSTSKPALEKREIIGNGFGYGHH
ncbi:hypothetical protein JYA63_10710 [Fictibacillus nanhaiensis]|uniref:Uncharacterized protein n=1 Tax=Fictibacillus nanhaiensis TaxID=742169 RepID=A0ABS2ZPD8_9BACL|nr:hypothetical protein [Fictibacillus nanhaiensis]